MREKSTPNTRSRTASQSVRERSLKIDKEISVAKQVRLLKEVERPKILIDEAVLSKPRPATYYIKKAKEQFQQRAASTVTSLCSEDRKAIFGPMLSLSVARKRENRCEEKMKTEDLGKKLLSKMMPEWLVERHDYQAVVRQMSSLELNIAEICNTPAMSRTEEEKTSLVNWVSSLSFFHHIPRRVIKDTCDKLTIQKFKAEDIIIAKGDTAECLYIIFSGKAEILKEEGGSREFLGPKKVIGEYALDIHKARSATIKAVEEVITFKLSKLDYETILLNVKKSEKYKSSKFLITIPYFKNWSYLKVQHLSNYLMKKTYQAGTIIYDKGFESDTFYIVKKGRVDIQAHVDLQQINRWPTGGKNWKIIEVNRKYIVTIASLHSGSFFGESTLIDQMPRLVRAVCATETVCLIINKEEFFDIFSVKDLETLQESTFVHIPKEQELQQKLIQEIKMRTESVLGK